MTAIVLFRRDLRLADNAALAAACQDHDAVIPVYIHEPGSNYRWRPGAASRWWLHHSLACVDRRFMELKGRLNICTGEMLPTLLKLVEQHDVSGVYWNRLYDPADITRDAWLKAAMQERGLHAQSFPGSLWHEPSTLNTGSGEPYRVFTPFWRNLRQQVALTVPLTVPRAPRWVQLADTVPVEALGLLPRVRWDGGFSERWQPGEAGAHRALQDFAGQALGTYGVDRDIPTKRGTSRLSPHLHFGEITPRQIHYALHTRAQAQPHKGGPDLEPYLRQLGWREFGHHLLYHFPNTSHRNFNRRFDRFPWAPRDPEAIERWQRGMTGIPLVDAGMRELWHTGWMHNRVRMVAASFLTKNLRQHWLEGARWFWDTLVDADLPNNSLGWQWVAGSGADAAPYFRVFNPVTQAKKFDPDGAYIRRWLPELAAVPDRSLHEPWVDQRALARSGYPKPLVDLGGSRLRALAAYKAVAR